MANANTTVALDLSTEIIVCMPFDGLIEYRGTRASLEADGLIPAGTEWPDGFGTLRWEDDTRRYWLRRARPEGAKGSRKQFANVDWWMFRFDPLQAKSFEARNIERKTKELAETIYRQSTKGQNERDKHWASFWAAQGDKEFQAFKALIPGLIRPKRGRKPKEVSEVKN